MKSKTPLLISMTACDALPATTYTVLLAVFLFQALHVESHRGPHEGKQRTCRTSIKVIANKYLP